MTAPSLQISKGKSMNEKTRLGIYLLFPPFLLWFFVALLGIDKTLADFLFQYVNSQTTGTIMVISGFVFPGTALFTGIHGIAKKEDFKSNLAISVISVLLIFLLAGFILLN